MQGRKGDTNIQNRLLDFVGEGRGGMIQENSIFGINPLSVASFAIIFSQSEGCLFVCFVVQKLLSFIRSHLFIFAFISNILGGGS